MGPDHGQLDGTRQTRERFTPHDLRAYCVTHILKGETRLGNALESSKDVQILRAAASKEYFAFEVAISPKLVHATIWVFSKTLETRMNMG